MTRQILLTFITCVVCTISTDAFAQVGKDTDLWDWTQDALHHQAIVRVEAGEGSGTGIIIKVDKSKEIRDGYEGYCLTAWHVVQDIHDNSIKVHYRSGRRSKGCRIIEQDPERDIALIWCWVPKKVVPAKLANKPIQGGDQLEFAGLGGSSDLKKSLRHFKGVASSPSSMEKIFADVPLLPGDSGGPVFNSNREVVGVISGGWFWYDAGVKLPNGSKIRPTWPARASNIDPIRVLMANIENPGETTTSHY